MDGQKINADCELETFQRSVFHNVVFNVTLFGC